jgi:hypothetical protein
MQAWFASVAAGQRARGTRQAHPPLAGHKLCAIEGGQRVELACKKRGQKTLLFVTRTIHTGAAGQQ